MSFLTKEQKGKAQNTAKHLMTGFVIGVILTGLFAFIITKKQIPQEREQPAEVIVVEDNHKEELEVTVDYIEKKLSNLSELSTAQMLYSGLCTVESGKIPLISKKGFSMAYQGEVKAGIDVSKIQTVVGADKVTVILPTAEIFLSHVLPESVQFYDEKHALFKKDEKTDVTQALKLAEDNMKDNANTDSLLTQAEKHAELLVQNLLQDAVGDREIRVMHSNGGN